MAAWQNELGQQLFTDFTIEFNEEPVLFYCNFYDAMTLIAHGIDFCMIRGLKYESGDILMN